MLRPLVCFSFAVALSVPARAQAPRATAGAPAVAYEIAFPNAAHHEAEVSATFAGLSPRTLEVRMSRSSPGRYALHEFAKNVYAVKAFDSRGKALSVTQANPHQWNVAGHDGTVRVTYTLYADRADGTYSGIDRTHAHLNIPATFMFARGLENRPVRVAFRPDGLTVSINPSGTAWPIATQLFPTDDPFVYTAPHLQYFMDSPTEIGAHETYRWTVSSGSRVDTIRVALHHLGTREDAAAYIEGTKKIVSAAQQVFGELPAFDRGMYTFLADYVPWASGDGMEHRNSTVLSNTGSLAANLMGLLGTVSHEFFHSWNVERIRPRALEPFTFEEANMSGELWLAEGFTNYYGPLIMRRAGLYGDSVYGRDISDAINTVSNAPGRKFFSPIGMSMQAPFVDAAASIDPQNRANTFISYYTYGEGIGLALDLEIRSRFPGKSLDTFMREMWRAHGAQRNFAPVRPYTLADVRSALARATGDSAFANTFWRRYIAGQEAPDYKRLLTNAGYLVRPARPGIAWMGNTPLRYENDRAIVGGGPLIGTPFYVAGVDRNDRIVSLGGRAIRTRADLDAVLAAHKPGDTVPIVYESRGSTLTQNLTFAESPQIEVVAYENAGRELTAAMKAFRADWLQR